MQNNFHFLRLFAAFLVFYGHGFALYGQGAPGVLNHAIGIYIFFAISGFLISMSWEKDSDVWRFLIKRSLRIFPALFVCIVLTVVILGPLLSNLSLKDYWKDPLAVNYLTNIVLLIQFNLPDVFSSNPYQNTVNGSLWSLPVEFLMYIGVAIVGKYIKTEYIKWIVPFIWVLFILLTLFWDTWIGKSIVIYNIDIKQAISTGTYFWAGASFYHLRLNKIFSVETLSLAMIVLIFVTVWPTIFTILVFVIIPFVVLAFGNSESRFLSFFNKADYSYGFYLYAFPVQQGVITLWPNLTIFSYFGICFFSILTLSMLSWHLIEKPCLQLKPYKKKV